MSKTDITRGSGSIAGLAGWMNARHAIYESRRAGLQPPWTDDPILRQYKFTNVFRELDHGTRTLRKALNTAIFEEAPAEDITFCVVWYRMFNWHENLTAVDWVADFDQLEDTIRERHEEGKKIFTGSHMTTGRPGERKVDTYLDVLEDIWDDRERLHAEIVAAGTISAAYRAVQRYELVGPFIAYEIASDLRWTPALGYEPPMYAENSAPHDFKLRYPNVFSGAADRFSWCNLGPGCIRGLQRIGLPATLDSVVHVARESVQYLSPLMRRHVSLENHINGEILPLRVEWPPYELREVEHSLCEYDKYERVRTGVGRPRELYNPERRRELL